MLQRSCSPLAGKGENGGKQPQQKAQFYKAQLVFKALSECKSCLFFFSLADNTIFKPHSIKLYIFVGEIAWLIIRLLNILNKLDICCGWWKLHRNKTAAFRSPCQREAGKQLQPLAAEWRKIRKIIIIIKGKKKTQQDLSKEKWVDDVRACTAQPRMLSHSSHTWCDLFNGVLGTPTWLSLLLGVSSAWWNCV